ncbi:MAG: hypothetical protein J6Z35_02275 [Lachnospiraceae bacterium]|nr:hypothetical protein [Lachnospiraceae bacterium]
MNVNGITSQAVSNYTPSSLGVKENTSEKEKKTASAVAEQGAVYEPSKEDSSVKKTYTPNPELVSKLKAEVENRTAQLQSLVEKMLTQQSNAFGKANDIWSVLRSGEFTVDPETKAQAQADIAEDGYFGVKQTSERILDFANALTGGDPAQLEKMRDAFKKGYEQAEKTWGGTLPEISQKTYDAVMEGFDKLAEEAGITFQN